MMEQKRTRDGRFDTTPHKVDPPKPSDVPLLDSVAPLTPITVLGAHAQGSDTFTMIKEACDAYEARYERLGLPVPAASKIIATKECMVCQKKGMMVVDVEELTAYREGAFVQDAFKTLDADEREQILTGTHGPCYDNIFSYVDDEEEDEDYPAETGAVLDTGKTYKIKGQYGQYTPVDGVVDEEGLATWMENPQFTLESSEEYVPTITYQTDPDCPRCKTDEYVPHYNCHYHGQAMGHSAAHCTADGCY